MRFLAGMLITADRLNDNSLDDSTTSGLVAATDFTVNSFSGRKVNGITTVHIYLQYTGTGLTISPSPGGNLGDLTIATLPSGWRPPEVINAAEGDGTTIGEVTIGTTGIVSLRATVTSIATGRNMRITATWISENA
jgi:hypothetical protein